MNDDLNLKEKLDEQDLVNDSEVDNSNEGNLSPKELKRLKKEELKKQKDEKRKKLLEEKERKRQERLKELEERKKQKQNKKQVEDETSEGEVTPKEKKPKPEKKPRPEKKQKPEKGPKPERKPKTYGDKMVPYEPEEDENPKIKLYNSIARAAYNMTQDRIPTNGLSNKETFRIFDLVRDDYPELFWLHSCVIYGESEVELKYRCLGKNGKIDKNQVAKKRNELRKAAEPFIKGITRKTDPYQAILTVYRRLILTLDYDGVGLVRDNTTFNDTSRDDNLRSLHSALVTHKVVCAGYAVAFQYLMNLIGVTSACVTSEFVNNSGHAFNVVRIKNKCYYVDPTWGDSSNTNNKDHTYDDLIGYDYFCVPYKELILTPRGQEHDHIPNKTEYPNLKQFDNTEYEYYRYHKAYFIRRDDRLLLELFINSVKNYDAKEMGQFAISFRTPSLDMMNTFKSYLQSTDIIRRLIEETKKNLKGTKYEKKLVYLNSYKYFLSNSSTYIITIIFDQPASKKQKKK